MAASLAADATAGIRNTLPGCNAVQQTTGALHFCNDSLTATAEPASQLRSDFH
jgi:hypothetical protein